MRKLLVKLISHEASHSVFMRMVVVNGCKVGNIRVFSCVFCKFSVFNSAHRHKSHDNVVTKEHSLSFPPSPCSLLSTSLRFTSRVSRPRTTL